MVEAYSDKPLRKADSLAGLGSLSQRVGSFADSSAVASAKGNQIQRELELTDIDLHTDSAGPAVENIAL